MLLRRHLFPRWAEVRRSRCRWLLAGVLPLVSITGCGAGGAPLVGAVTFTDVKGASQPAVTSLQHGATVYLDVTLARDPESLGADWTVTCSNALPPGSLPAGMVDTSCGTFFPNHTMSGPVPVYPGVTGIVTQFTAPGSIPKAGTVTITVHSTSLPSSTSSVTLGIT